MSDFEADGFYDDDWSECGELSWNEFDWERYLRVQDEGLHRYLAIYESVLTHPRRIDEVARQLGWGEWEGHEIDLQDEAADTEAKQGDDATAAPTVTLPPVVLAKTTPAEAAKAAPSVAASLPSAVLSVTVPQPAPLRSTGEPSHQFGSDFEVYTLHKNPVYVATRALYLRLRRNWELLAASPESIPLKIALPYLSSLHAGETHALQAIQAVEFGDYAMSVCLFKRALAALNQSLGLLAKADTEAAKNYAESMRISLFDLREIWLRVSQDSREEFNYWLHDDEP
ncbi:hypothetical protein AXK11_03935 [Cephaloticoccus primus]|uniref:Uncharacterized protein n=2 Tax=Cephaloticoccus primus TaxID=1548207 RepID=A0A139SPN6_9BACT|nr:hypothetical protein AXK11_03935 [Cephaloticoccus primus]